MLAEIPTIELLDRGTVARPEGIVYSTDPFTSLGDDGRQYVVKGPDPNIVVSEALAYILAGLVGIRTPGFVLGYFAEEPTELWFASVKEENVIRSGDQLLVSHRTPASIVAMGDLVAFDAWIANIDRNAGNVLVRMADVGDELAVIAIDFEKAQALRGPHPLMQTSSVALHNLRPTGDLARVMTRPVQWQGAVKRITGLSNQQLNDAVKSVESKTEGAFGWAESTLQVLRNRRDRLDPILAEIWK